MSLPAVQSARARVLVPFQAWTDGVPAALAARRGMESDNAPAGDHLWVPGPPAGLDNVRLLHPVVGALLGYTSVDGAVHGRRLHLHRRWIAALFGEPARLDVLGRWKGKDRDGATVVGTVGVKAVEVLLLPAGCGFLVFDLDLAPETLDGEPGAPGLGAVRNLLSLLRRRFGEQGVGGHWRLGRGTRDDAAVARIGEEAIRRAARDGISLDPDTLTRFLLHIPSGGIEVTLAREVHVQFGIVLDRPPADEVLHDELFRLRRAFDDRHAPGAHDPGDLDRVRWLRRHRIAAIAREAAGTLSWPPDASDRFEAATWPDRLVRLYGDLGMLVVAEHTLLERHGRQASAAIREDVATNATDVEELQRRRDALLDVARRMAEAMALLSWEDPGGHTDYAAWFEDYRSVHRVREARAELRAQLQDVLQLAEMRYRDAATSRADQEALRVQERERHEEMEHRVESRRRATFERKVAMIATVFTPIAVCSGLLGVNTPDLGLFVWAGLVGLIGLAGAAILRRYLAAEDLPRLLP